MYYTTQFATGECDYTKDLEAVKAPTCCCSKLRHRIRHLKKHHNINASMVNKAIQYAKDYHGKQLRQSGEPYYTHPIEVATMVTHYVCKEDIIVASLLHDTLEDTVLTKDCIAAAFGEYVATKVELLTRVVDGVKISAVESLARLIAHDKKDLVVVKLCDRLHNIKTVYVKAPDKVLRIVRETEQHFVPTAEELGLERIRDLLVQYCKMYKA